MRAVVTGGGGFLGRRIVALLRERGDTVTVVDRQARPDAVDPTVVADIRDTATMRTAFAGADAVFHCAGKVGFWGEKHVFWSVNVDGTKSVLAAARDAGISRLVFTSTPSVVGYAHDVENGGPDLPYAAVHENAYAETKCVAEQLVLAANGAHLATVALRPHVLIGPGDERMLPGVMDRAARGRLRVIGDGANRIDLTYIDNAAWAHLDAAAALADARAPCAGRPYFITNGQPVVLWEWLNALLGELDLPAVHASLRLSTAQLAALVTETVWKTLPVRGDPPLTRALATVLARSHWYDIEPARRDLGYRVRVSMEEANRRTARWLAQRYWAAHRHDARSTAPAHAAGVRERPDYYITPTHDFTQYTKDYEAKYWSQDTAFEWHQSVPQNLKTHLDALPPQELSRIARLALPLVLATLSRRISDIHRYGLPIDGDALKAIAESIPSNRPAIADALAMLAPLELLASPVAGLVDQLAIVKRQLLELREHQRLGLFKDGTQVHRRATETESREQAIQIDGLEGQIRQTEQGLRGLRARDRAERVRLETSIRARLDEVEPLVLADLEETRAFVRDALRAHALPTEAAVVERLRELVWKRQLRGLKDIANHALVVEQSAIAPLTMGVIHYKRRREIQQAMTTFVNDEAKHSAVFRRFMAQKLEAKEHVSDAVIKGSERYMWLARFMPSGGVFLAVIVEAIGAAYLEFFGEEQNMPEPLFRSICRTIAGRDEKRHMDLCAATYNELYRTGSRWERLRNHVALRVMMKAAYGDKNEDHSLLQACRAFGLEASRPYQHVAAGLSAQLQRIGMYVPPADLLGFMRLRRTEPHGRAGS